MFSMRNFVKDGFLKAVGKMADYQVILNAASWHEKGVLTTEDLAEIQTVIEAKNAQGVAEEVLAGEEQAAEVSGDGAEH